MTSAIGERGVLERLPSLSLAIARVVVAVVTIGGALGSESSSELSSFAARDDSIIPAIPVVVRPMRRVAIELMKISRAYANCK